MNPWIDAHVEAETEMQGGNRRLARALVANEYRDAPAVKPCWHQTCDGTMHYKATIGALKCDTCGGLAHTNGEAL